MKNMLRISIIALLWLGAVGSAPAEGLEDAVTYTVTGEIQKIKAYTYPGYTTAISFQSTVFALNTPEFPNLVVEQQPGNLVVLHAGVVRPGKWGSFHVQAGHFDVVIEVHGASDPSQVHTAIQVVHESQVSGRSGAVRERAAQCAPARSWQVVKKERDQLKAQVAQLEAELAERTSAGARLAAENDGLRTRLAEQERHHEQEQKRWAEESRARERAQVAMATDHVERSILGDLIEGNRIEALPNSVTNEPGVVFEFERWGKMGRRRVGFFTLENRSHQAYSVGRFQMLDQLGVSDHAGKSVIGDAIEPPAQGVLAIIPARTRVRGIVQVREPENVGTHVTFAMSEPEGTRPVTSERVPVWDLTPLFEDPPDENIGKTTLGPVASYGAVWIPNPMAALGELDATSIQSLGMRLSYGLHKRINFETEAVYASTGEASFADGGTRLARLGRVLVGGVLRLGSGRWIPIVRGGVGLQGAYFSGVGEGFEFDLTWQVGGGLDIKAGPFVLGLGLSGGKGSATWFEGGLHLGYSWKP